MLHFEFGRGPTARAVNHESCICLYHSYAAHVRIVVRHTFTLVFRGVCTPLRIYAAALRNSWCSTSSSKRTSLWRWPKLLEKRFAKVGPGRRSIAKRTAPSRRRRGVLAVELGCDRLCWSGFASSTRSGSRSPGSGGERESACLTTYLASVNVSGTPTSACYHQYPLP